MSLSARPRYLAALTLAVGLLLASHAFATVKPNVPPKETPAPVANGGYANAQADADSNAVSVSNAHASQHQDQTANASSTSEGSSASNSFSYSNRETRQAPSVFAPAVYASSPCAIGGSVGLSGPGFGVSGGKARTDEPCNLREMIRVLTPLNPALALALACTDPAVKAVAGDEGCKLPPAPQLPCTACTPAVDEGKVREIAREEASAAATKAFRAATSK